MPPKKTNLTQLGRRVAPIPPSPAEAKLEAVPNPHPGMDYVVRFTAPEFTCLCPVTGQPDFAHFVVDYCPGKTLVESKSFKLFLNSFRNHPAFHEDTSRPQSSRNSCASPATGIRAAAFPSMSFGRRENCRRTSGCRTSRWNPIAGAANPVL